MKLSKRDFEIMRTLVRVQLASTVSLGAVFFSDMRAARRRLHALRNTYGLLERHAKGLPDEAGRSPSLQYWRLTELGLQVFSERFPAERIPDNHNRRSRSASLLFHSHRDAMTNLYLGLLVSKEQDIDAIAEKADAAQWEGEHEVRLDFLSVQGAKYHQKYIVPDGTLTTASRRYFLEVDKSTESRKRCRQTLKNYAKAMGRDTYQKRFSDGLPVTVLYVTDTDLRAASLQEMIGSIQDSLPFEAKALARSKALQHLGYAMCGETEAPAGEPSRELTLLRGIYDEHCNMLNQMKARGETPVFSSVVMESYEYLQTLEKAS